MMIKELNLKHLCFLRLVFMFIRRSCEHDEGERKVSSPQKIVPCVLNMMTPILTRESLLVGYQGFSKSEWYPFIAWKYPRNAHALKGLSKIPGQNGCHHISDALQMWNRMDFFCRNRFGLSLVVYYDYLNPQRCRDGLQFGIAGPSIIVIYKL